MATNGRKSNLLVLAFLLMYVIAVRIAAQEPTEVASPAADLGASPILLLHFDEAQPPVRDTGEEDHPVEVHGTQLGRPGIIQRACGFDGKDDYVKADAMTCFPQQTIMLWVRPNPSKAAGGILASQAKPGQSSWRWRISRNADKTVSFYIWDSMFQPESTRQARSQAPLPDDKWSHVAVTIDTTAQQFALYVDGKPAATEKVTTNVPYGSLFVGTATFEGYFAGEVDEVAVFERVLSADQIAQYAASRQAIPNAPVIDSDTFVLKPVGDKAWFTFRHRKFGRRRWMLRMPEYMHYDEQLKTNRTPYGVKWEVLDNYARLKFRFDLPEEKKELGLDFWGEIVAHEDTIDYTLTVTNAGDKAWDRQRVILFCMQSGAAEGFRDYHAKRTFVRMEDKWITMNEVVQDKFAQHRMCGVEVGKGKASRLAARVSEDGKVVLGLATDIATSLSFNFQDRIACMHSNPYWGMLKPGQTVTAKGKVYLFEGTLDDLWKRYVADFEATDR